MHLYRFDLNLLVTLDALLTEKNVTRAGLRMNLSQPAMSGGLARLREFFQDELLVPMGRQTMKYSKARIPATGPTPLERQAADELLRQVRMARESLGVDRPPAVKR